MDEHERLTDDELAALIVAAEKGKGLGRLLGDEALGRFSSIVDALRELHVLRAENARLRAALEAIATLERMHVLPEGYHVDGFGNAKLLARRALEGGTDG